MCGFFNKRMMREKAIILYSMWFFSFDYIKSKEIQQTDNLNILNKRTIKMDINCIQ